MTSPMSAVDVSADRTPNIIASVVVLWVAAFVVVVLRVLARRISGSQLGLDDWLIVFSLLPFTATCIGNFVGASLGAGKHVDFVLQTNPGNIGPFLKYIYAVELLYPFVIAPIKCSILSLFIRIFGIGKPFKIYCQALIALTIAWAIATELGSIFQCRPVEEAWDPLGNRSTCLNLKALLVGTNVPNIVLDFSILTAPLRPIWKLRLPTSKKVLISAVLMLGAGETAFSIVRLVMLTGLQTTDVTWDYFSAIVWSTVEQSIGIICVCLPVLGPLLPKSVMDRRTLKKGSAEHPTQFNSAYGMQSIGRKKFNKLDDRNPHFTTTNDDLHSILQTTEISIREG